MTPKTIHVLNKIDIEKYPFIIFDCFGTLLNIQTFYPFQEVQEFLKISKNDLLKKTFNIEYMKEKLSSEIFQIFQEKLQKDLKNITIFQDAERIINLLERKNIKYSICSNLASVYGESVEKFFSKEKLILSYIVGYKKPEKEIYQICEKNSCEKKENILFVGDNLYNDYLKPIKYGFQALYLKRI